MTTSVSAMIPPTSPGKSTLPARDMPSHAAGSAHARASSASRLGYAVRQSSSSGAPSTGGVSVSSPNSFLAAAVNASARPPTCPTRSLRLSFWHGVRALSCASVTFINTSAVRWHAGVKSIMSVLTWPATGINQLSGLVWKHVRFAIKTSPQNTTWSDMLAVWQAADDIDVFESGWTFDHFYPIFSDSSGPCLEGWTTLTALAQATKRLRVGVLGTGAGWNEEESGAYGIELGSIKERFDRFEEACEILTSLLTNDTTTFDGKYYQLKDARNEPKGPQKPHPPICIGGSGEKRTLPLTAKYADHWNFVGGPPEEFARKRDVLAARCADIGRDPKEITLSAHVRLEPDLDYAKAVDEAGALGKEGLDLAIVYLPPPHDPAVLEPLAEAIRDSGLNSKVQ